MLFNRILSKNESPEYLSVLNKFFDNETKAADIVSKRI